MHVDIGQVHFDLSKTIVIGDNLDTDIAFGERVGLSTPLTITDAHPPGRTISSPILILRLTLISRPCFRMTASDTCTLTFRRHGRDDALFRTA